jgi:hypothetical protein
MIQGRNLQQVEDAKPKAQSKNRNASAAASHSQVLPNNTTTNASTVT